MKPTEIFKMKRMNFIEKTQLHFQFLVSEFGFSNPEHIISKQPNGTVTRDEFEYSRSDKTISVLNAYHPVDYGFEINMTENETGKTEKVRHVLKEEQNREQNYLKIEAEFIKKFLGERLNMS